MADTESSGSGGLVIVAPERFHPALLPFVEHKRKLLPTTLESLEQILQKSEGGDDPERLKKRFYQSWKSKGTGYVLLLGDVDTLPVRYMVLDRVTPAAFDYAFYPSDLYYADLAKRDKTFEDWNASRTGFHATYFGEVRGEKNKTDPINYDQIDYLPEIAIGRWPVSTVEEVQLIARKTMAYELAVLEGKEPFLKRAAFFSVGGWVDTRSLMDQVSGGLAPGWQIEKRYYSDEQPAKTAAPDHVELRGLFNKGLGFAVHTGHGQSDAWEQCFHVSDLDKITNSSALAVILSAGCSTAYFAPLPPYGPYVDIQGKEHAGTDHNQVFDQPPPAPSPYQRGKYNPTGLGEQVLKRNDRGGVAYIGCNTGSQPCALSLVTGFVRSLASRKEPRLGDCWSDAIRYYHRAERLESLKPTEDWYPPSIFFQGMKFMVFGDPSLRMPENSPP